MLKTNNLREINKLRGKLGERFLQEKLYGNRVSEETVRESQILDIPIALEQRRLFEEYKRKKALSLV